MPKRCLSKVLIDENRTDLSKMCECKKCFAKESYRIFYIKVINFTKNACYLFSLSRNLADNFTGMVTNRYSISFAKNLAKIIWMATLGYMLEITPSSVLPVPLLLELITNIWTNHPAPPPGRSISRVTYSYMLWPVEKKSAFLSFLSVFLHPV